MTDEKLTPHGAAESGGSHLCPSCEGDGKLMAFGIMYAPGHDGPWAKELDCHRCKGSGVVGSDQLRWIERGGMLRKLRRDNGLALHDAAKQLGLRPSEISGFECGDVDNTNWNPRYQRT